MGSDRTYLKIDLKQLQVAGLTRLPPGNKNSSPPPEKCDRRVFMEDRKLSTPPNSSNSHLSAK